MKTKYFGDEGLSVIFTVSTKKKVPLISRTLSCYMQLDWQPLKNNKWQPVTMLAAVPVNHLLVSFYFFLIQNTDEFINAATALMWCLQ